MAEKEKDTLPGWPLDSLGQKFGIKVKKVKHKLALASIFLYFECLEESGRLEVQ